MSTNETTNYALKEVLGYTPPKLYVGVEWYVGFYAFDPARRKMRRKKIKLNYIEKIGERRSFAAGLIKRLNYKLERGWNPWIESENSKAYHTITDVFNHYRRHIDKLFRDDVYREDTYVSYVSYLRNIENWNLNRKNPATYIYQFNEDFICDLLEHVHIDRDNSAQTRDNYLGFMKTFSAFLVEKRYLKVKPTNGISSLGKKSKKKKRQYIPDNEVIRIKEYLEQKNKYFLLASYVLHYCFIRPKEMSKIRISDISLKNKTIFIPEENSKNRTGLWFLCRLKLFI